ncbi:MAG TPA: prepilin-type N-terminal cleavage/methylation domain-containing protein [Acidimicrobiia bacterium]
MRARSRAERGETLIELMITVAVMGLAMVAILGGIWTTLRATDLNTQTSNADTVVRAYAEALSQGCTTTAPDPDSSTTVPAAGDPSDCTGPDNVYHYVPCTTAGGQVTYPPYLPQAPYAAYTVAITKIRYLSGYSGTTPTWANTCSATDLGLQEITLTATGPAEDPAVKDTETVTIVKRNATADVPLGSA